MSQITSEQFNKIARKFGLDALTVRLLDDGSLFATVHVADLRLSSFRVENGCVVYPAGCDANGA